MDNDKHAPTCSSRKRLRSASLSSTSSDSEGECSSNNESSSYGASNSAPGAGADPPGAGCNDRRETGEAAPPTASRSRKRKRRKRASSTESRMYQALIYYPSNCSVSSQAGPKLVIDHDGGADDAMAIFLALLYEEYYRGPTVIGLTTSHGNVPENQTFVNSQRFLDIARRRDVPIYRGSKDSLVLGIPSDYFFGVDGLGDLENVQYQPIAAQPEHAVNALIDLSKKFQGELTVVVMGALTNIALAVRLDPNFISRLNHLYVAAGNIFSDAHLDPEFNAEQDAEAYYIVAEKSTPEKVTFIPFSPFRDLFNITVEWRQNVLGAINTTIMHNQNQFERTSQSVQSRWTLLDPNAMAMVLDNALIGETRCSNNSIILCGDDRGINTNNFLDCSQSNANIAFPAPQEGFQAFFYDVFSAELRK